MVENSTIAFYKGNAVRKILERYEFSEAERKVINAAILTARKEKPDYSRIVRADALLNEVAKTRTPIQNEEAVELDADTIAAFDMMKLEYSQHKEETKRGLFSKEKRLIWGIGLFFVIMAIMFSLFQARFLGS